MDTLKMDGSWKVVSYNTLLMLEKLFKTTQGKKLDASISCSTKKIFIILKI